MIDAFRIGTTLTLDTNMAAALPPLIRSFMELERQIDRAQMSANNLATALRGAGRISESVASSWARTATAMERSAAAVARASRAVGSSGGATGAGGGAGGGGGGGGGPRLAIGYAGRGEWYSSGNYQPPYSGPQLQLGYDGPGQGFTTSGEPYTRSGGALRGYTGGGGGADGGGGRSASFNGGGPIPLNFGPAVGAGRGLSYGDLAGAYFGIKAVDGFMHPSVEGADAIEKLRAARFTDAQLNRAKTMAMQTVRDTPGMKYGDALNLIGQNNALTGDADEAMNITPKMAGYARVLALLGKGDAINQVEAAARAGEVTGLTNAQGKMDVPKLLDFVGKLTRTAVSSGAAFDINKYLTGIRQFGAAGAGGASDDFLTNQLPAYQMALGAPRAGTALRSLQQMMLAPPSRMQNKRFFAEQERLGLRDKNGTPLGMDLLTKDPAQYFTQFVLPKLLASGYNTPGLINQELNRALPRATVTSLMAEGILNRGTIEKEAERNRRQQAAGDAPLGRLLTDSPGNQIAAFQANFEALEVVLGDTVLKPATEGLKSLTGVLQNFADWAKQNSKTVKVGLEALAEGVALFAAGKVANLALMSLAGKGPGGLFALALGIDVLSGSIKGFPQWLVNLATGAAIGARVAGVPGAMVGGAIGLAGPHLFGPLLPHTPGFHEERIPYTPFYREVPGEIKKESYITPAPVGRTGRNGGVGDVYLDGRKVGRIVFGHMADEANRPASGGVITDPRSVTLRPGLVPA